MAKPTTVKEISRGMCYFCQQEFPKNKMTQHLKSCKARTNIVQEQEQGQTTEPQKIFHLRVEGKYRPEFWMHLEISAAATLGDLDSFLRYVWLECCDHLSEFVINGESFGSDSPPGFGDLLMSDEDEEADEDGEDNEAAMPNMQEISARLSSVLQDEFQTDLSNVPVDQITSSLEKIFAESMPAALATTTLPMLRPMLGVMAQSLHDGTLEEDMAELDAEAEDEPEDPLDFELDEVLEVGQDFSYVYDFGSSSTLSLRVLGEREGVVPMLGEEEEAEEHDHNHDHEHEHHHHDHAHEHDHEHTDEEDEDEEDEEDEEDVAILIMARNNLPHLVCHICGQPAQFVPSASEYNSLASIAYCEKHARSDKDYSFEEFLPIVNSPRTGICAYGSDEGEWEFEEDDEDEDDGEEE